MISCNATSNYAINLCRLTHCKYNKSVQQKEQLQLELIRYSKCCLSGFKFTFAKRQIQSNIVHRMHSTKFRTQTTSAPFLAAGVEINTSPLVRD